MFILSNALTNVADEGCVKVANSLVKRLKKSGRDVSVLSFERQSDLADEQISSNKLLLSRGLISRVRKHKGDVTYIPFPAKPIATAIRIFMLSLYAGKNLRVMMSLTTKMDFVSRLLLKMSRAKFIVFSRNSFDFYSSLVGEKRVNYLKTGVDTEKFVPVSPDRASQLKEKYGFDADKKLVLHVGHLKAGRNIAHLKNISSEHQVLLVTSTLTKDEQDIALRNDLLSCRNIRIIDTYLPDIEEIYQMSDVYFFPVVEEGNCIDVPLSCMEAASCGKPIVTTDFGEMSELIGKDGFYLIDSFEPDEINKKITQALSEGFNTRAAVLDYDWKNAVSQL